MLILASLNVFFRDLAADRDRRVLMIAFYLTPILYPESLVPGWAAPLLAVNPLRDAIALFRAGLVGMPRCLRGAGWPPKSRHSSC